MASMNYEKVTAKYEKYLADLDTCLSDLEAQTEVVHVPIEVKNQKPRVSKYICKLCFEPIKYEDHGTCRRCRTRLKRQKELATDQKALIAFNMIGTGSRVVDDAIIKHAGGFCYSQKQVVSIEPDYDTKEEFEAAFESGIVIRVTTNVVGVALILAPAASHDWYARVEVRDGIVTRIY